MQKGDSPGLFEDIDNYASDLMSHEPGDCMEGAEELDSYEQDRIHIGKHMGRLTEQMINKQESIENIMRGSGWFDTSPDGPLEYDSLKAIEPSICSSPKEWDKQVLAKREEALHE